MINTNGFGAAKESDLSTYGYDMVASTTQLAINTTMKEMLYRMKPYILETYYKAVVSAQGTISYEEGNYDELVKGIGMDLFDIPGDSQKRTDKQNKAINKAYNDYHFAFGFKAKMGFDNLEKLAKEPNMIDLFESDATSVANVLYHMYFDEFKIVQIQQLYGNILFSNLQQLEDKFWTFDYNVKLLLDAQQNPQFKDLPENIQKQLIDQFNNKVKDLNPNTMFSIQQLYFDLNNTWLMSTPKITGLDPQSDAYIMLTKTFINGYFKKLQSEGGVVLGYTVTPDFKDYGNPIITPTNFQFYISPDVNDKSDKDLFTLNYIVMAKNRPIPLIKPFTWNWVDKDQISKMDGSIAINRIDVSELIKPQLLSVMDTLLYTPYVNFEASGIKVSMDYGFNKFTGKKPDYTYVEKTKGENVLVYNFNKYAESSDTSWLLAWGNLSIKYNVDSKVKFSGNKIIVTTNVSARVHINIEGGVTEGNAANYEITDTYDLYVDNFGKLIFKHENKIADNSESIDSNVWAKIASFGTATDAIKTICNSVKDFVNEYANYYSNKMDSCLNDSLCWVFPGAASFLYKNVEFSNGEDLIVDVTYTTPE